MINNAQKALNDEIARLSGLEAGTRNAELFYAAIGLGKLPIDRDTLRDKLIDACEANGHLSDDGLACIEATIQSGLRMADVT